MNKVSVVALVLFSYTVIGVGTIGKAMLTPFHLVMGILLVVYALYVEKKNIQLFLSLLLLMGYMIFNNILNYPIRFTSLTYSIIYGLELIVLYNLLRHCSKDLIKKAFYFIIASYGVNIVIGFLLIKLGLKIPVLEIVIGIVRNESGVRAMGFSSEPSYASFIISVAYLAYNTINDHEFNKQTAYLSAIYFIPLLLLGSAYGLMFGVVTLIDWAWIYYKRMSPALRQLFPLLGIIIVYFGYNFVMQSKNEAVERIESLAETLNDPYSTVEKKLAKLQEDDPSAFARIAPTYLLIQQAEDEDFSLWMGAGAGTAGVVIPAFFQGVLIDDDDGDFDVGIMPSFIYDYGLIGLMLLLVFFIISFRNLPFPFWLFLILVAPNAGINTQMLWFVLTSFVMVSTMKSNESFFSKRNQISNNEMIKI